MKPSESVNEYYHRLFKLWQQAGTPEDEKLKKFKGTLKPSISTPLLALRHTSMRDLLDSARLIEEQKKTISSNFPRDSTRPAAAVATKVFKPLTKNPMAAQTIPPAAVGTNTPARDARPGNPPNPNARFMPTSTKPQGWAGTWYDPERQPRRLQGIEQAVKKVSRNKFVQDRNAERDATRKNNAHRSNKAIVDPPACAAPQVANSNLSMARISQSRAQTAAPPAVPDEGMLHHRRRRCKRSVFTVVVSMALISNMRSMKTL